MTVPGPDLLAQATDPSRYTSEGAQALGAGVSVRLADGQVWPLRFGMEALLRLEQQYGSIEQVQDRFNEIMADDKHPGLLQALVDVLVPGLLEAAEDHDVPEQRIVRLIDPGQIGAYMEAFQLAIQQAFPNAGAAAAAPKAGRGKAPTSVAKAAKGSRGRTGTTSGRAGTAAARASSGG